MSDTFEEGWRQLKDLIQSKQIPSEKSAFWEKLIKDFPTHELREEFERDLFKLNSLRNYNFLERDKENFATKVPHFPFQDSDSFLSCPMTLSGYPTMSSIYA